MKTHNRLPMIIHRLSKLKPICLILLVALALPASGQNIFSSLKEKITGSNSTEKVEKKTKSNKNPESPDPLELSLDENLAMPEIPEKYHDQIVAHMNTLAKKLAAHKRERVETMRNGEIVVATITTDLLFAPNDTVLGKNSHSLLNPYANLLHQPGMYKVVIVCHTDNTGSEKYTDALSEARVNSVSEYLLHGSNDNHATLVPYALGASDPLYPNNTMDNRRANRRLEIFIVPDVLLIEMAKANKLQ